MATDPIRGHLCFLWLSYCPYEKVAHEEFLASAPRVGVDLELEAEPFELLEQFERADVELGVERARPLLGSHALGDLAYERARRLGVRA